MHPNGGWINLDRASFDSSLMSIAKDYGAYFFNNKKLTKLRYDNSGFSVSIGNKLERTHLCCRFLVDATGKSSYVSRLLGAKKIYLDRLICIMGILDVGQFNNVERYILIEPIENGWWYSALIPDNKLIASVFTDSDLVPNVTNLRKAVWYYLLLKAPLTKDRVASYKLSNLNVVSASSSIISRLSGQMWASVGDACCTFDPLSSHGISHSIESGKFLSKVIDKVLSNNEKSLDEYRIDQVTQFDKYMEEKESYYKKETRWINNPFWHRRQHPNELWNRTKSQYHIHNS